MKSSQLIRVREGATDLMVPAGFCTKGPGTSTKDVFYNRQMEFSRDVSVLFGRVVFEPGWRILDGLAATGARGLRMANECAVDARFALNDWSDSAAALVRRNAEENDLRDIEVHSRALGALLSEEVFDYIDIDPFGTPVPFVDTAVQSCHDGGVVAVTATDTAPLSGTYPKTCNRRYGALSARSPFAHETGLRILMGYIAREAAKHDRGCEPLLCYHADHYFRCYLRIRRGARRADRALDELGFATFDAKTLRRDIVPDRPGDSKKGWAGPLWTGRLHSADVLKHLAGDDSLGTNRRCEKSLLLWRGESDAPALFYRVDELSSLTKRHPPRLARLIEQLRASGAAATQTHFDPKGLKTDAPLKELLRVFEEVSVL